MSVYLSMTTAASRTFNVVSSSALALEAVTTSLADMAQAGAAHAASYRRTTEASLADAEEELVIAGSMNLQANIADKLIAIQDRLDANPKLAQMYAKVGLEMTARKAARLAA